MPPIADAGLAGYEMVAWVGAFLPAKSPTPIVARLNQEFLKAIGDDKAVEYFNRVGGEPYPSTPDELGRFVLVRDREMGEDRPGRPHREAVTEPLRAWPACISRSSTSTRSSAMR